MTVRSTALAAAACAGLAAILSGAGVVLPKLLSRPRFHFVRTEVMVPMRDGVKLQTAIFVPRGWTTPLPILLTRTPYGVPEDGDADVFAGTLEPDGYVFAYQNVRGRFASEGTFMMQRPRRDPSDPKSVDESTDAYDTVAWLVANVPNNSGRVGISGTSYPGFLTAAALAEPHPALACASERAAMDDLFVNDDFHHGGALRLSYAFEYGYSLEKDRTKGSSFQHDRQDLYDWYLRLGALSHVDERYFHGEMPTWNALVAHPNHDAFWTSRAPSRYLAHAAIPTQNVAGWFDQEDFVGPMSVYATLERTDEARLDTLVVGPWNHGGWSRDPGRKLGDIDFGSDVTTDFKARFTRPFWAHCLHGAPDPKLPEAAIFETGRNVWRDLPAWPPKTGVTPTRLYLHAGRAASFDAPAGDEAPDAFVSDPSNPVPYRHRPIGPTYGAVGWSDWLVEDQRFVDHRPDVLTWETPPLDHDVEIGGELEADLYASTTGTDADWVVKLIDVLPEANDAVADPPSLRGYELMVASDILRGRFRDGLEAPKPVAAGEIVPYRVDLHTRAHAFLKGHRIMVQVQSTWFPLYDRNPQTYVDNVFRARDEDFTKATHTVVHDAAHPSSVVLPVVHWE